MRDIIRSYGVDCIYSKLNTSCFENYKGIVDKNLILTRAYGYNLNPDYHCTARMITYMEVGQDILQLQKYGLNPNTDVDFYFDSTDFACALATQCGQYQEFKINEKEVSCEVGDFPFAFFDTYECGLLSGQLSVVLSALEAGDEDCIPCHHFQESGFKIHFPANKDLYKSLQHRMKSEDQLKTQVLLDYTVTEEDTEDPDTGEVQTKKILHGKIHGGVLFYNLSKVGKYIDKIHPEVGDIVTIDFPDEANPERYEVTDCYEKSLQSDGISPLLHKYIWKCKARRYVNNYDDFPENEADKQQEEKQQLEKVIDEEVNKSIEGYRDDEDAAYGGYDLPDIDNEYDAQLIDEMKHYKHIYVDDGSSMDILKFACGSKLVTTGYELLFVDAKGDAYQITTEDHPLAVAASYFEESLRFLKATKDLLMFVNIEGTPYKIIEDEASTDGKIEICLNSMYEKTIDPAAHRNHNGQNFYIFKESRTVLWATPRHLYCKLASQNVHQKII